jgi:hypothetical protein
LNDKTAIERFEKNCQIKDMGHADDFINSFLERNPKAKSGQLTLDELNKLMAEHQQRLNDMPKDDFDGVSASQMHVLLNFALDGNCVMQYREAIDSYLDRIPLFKLSELLLNTIRDAGTLKLTIKGNLPVKVCELLFNQQLINWPYMKYITRIREEEVPFLWPLKQYLLDQGIIKKRNNALSLTQKGEKLMGEAAFCRFENLFHFFTDRFHWANFYDTDDGGKCGQLGWAYSLLMLSRYGDQPRESSFYSLKAMLAFEPELHKKRNNKEYVESTRLYHRTFDTRFFECFANWFGLVNIERKKNPQISLFDQLIVTKSELFNLIFQEVKP